MLPADLSPLIWLTDLSFRISRRSKARWRTVPLSCSMLRQEPFSMKKLTYGYVYHVSRLFILIVTQSLGCTLYALAYLHSPFENTQTTEQGGSIAMAVLNAQYKHPSSAYSQGLKDLIDSLLKLNPAERPDIHEVCILITLISIDSGATYTQVIKMTDRVLQTLA